MNALRYLLFPFSAIYYVITGVRNFLFDKSILKSSEFDLPIILVGNLSTGGTGKTPHVEYLIRLLKNSTNLATLSRGYGRKTPGFQQAKNESTALNIGDEPLQFFTKYHPNINVFVEAKRVDGIIKAIQNEPEINCFLLDDAFQHRAIKAGFSILLSDYNKPFYNDHILPVGNLRESKLQKKRADIIIVSKCPNNLNVSEQNQIINKINPLEHQKVYFSTINYRAIKSFNENYSTINLNDLLNKKVLLITGIANHNSLTNKLDTNKINYKHLPFPDHHNYTSKNISNIINIFDSFSETDKIILTTEKDAVRMKDIKELTHLPVYYIEIEIDFLTDKQHFNQQITAYVEQNKRDS